MAGISTPLREVLTKLETYLVQNQEGRKVPIFARVFNDQFRKLKEGLIQYVPMPCAFVEIVSPSEFASIGGGISASDIIFRIHIGHENYDNGNNTFDQDLIIYELRDGIVSLLSGFKPTGFGVLDFISETASYDHDNVNEYIVEFIANFIDDTTATDRDKIYTTPPTEIEYQVNVTDHGDHQQSQHNFIINGSVNRSN